MKSTVVLVALTSMLLQSCYSYFGVTGEERQTMLNSGSDGIQIVLSTGEEVVVDPYHYVYVAEPTDGIYVAGELTRGTEKEKFHGIVHPTRIDSSEAVVKRLFMLETRAVYYTMLQSDSSTVTCTKDDMIRLSKEQGAGLWVNGYIITKSFMGAKETKAYVGKVPESDAQHVEQHKISWLRSAGTALAIGTVIAVTVIAYPANKNP
ncbi:MAG TPA: hypothetical protein VL633_13075 [Bacteroidota bacterium]|nr:hypothetical protein [Bacteroidota bacterium]